MEPSTRPRGGREAHGETHVRRSSRGTRRAHGLIYAKSATPRPPAARARERARLVAPDNLWSEGSGGWTGTTPNPAQNPAQKKSAPDRRLLRIACKARPGARPMLDPSVLEASIWLGVSRFSTGLLGERLLGRVRA